ncbi:ABC transporter permease [Dongia soli]|uniref:ABC transporter permease n=1 Tax=Dongia soli TaxID=600628 RepID=A0ABU5EFI7_9PROT|nr:ABC transporter permease [Dongia soli]MDY0885179.1 ABC transporter permease [Dongia soli]
MTSKGIFSFFIGFYLLLFFAYLFGPLLIMGATAFNNSSYPQLWPWEGFTLYWFIKLANDQAMLRGIGNSLLVGLGVICLAVPIGLAGAIVMTQIYWRARALYYLIVVSPLLTPGVIIGISTVLFWRQLLGANQPLYSGYFMTILGQATFISAYCMLIFLSRLQRFDRAQEEAALDLGASNLQFFWQVLLPFLRPAVFSAAVLAFLSSFENYNTTTFTILARTTLTTELAGRVRQGSNPSLSALALLIITITLIGAILYEIYKRREDRREKARAAVAAAAAEAEGEPAIAAA